MSASGGKGSNRRPGEGYSEGWDRVFGKKDRDVVHTSEELLYEDNLSRMPEIQAWNKYVMQEREKSEPICKNCKHSSPAYWDKSRMQCDNEAIHNMSSEGSELWPDADFGCNRWGKKE